MERWYSPQPWMMHQRLWNAQTAHPQQDRIIDILDILVKEELWRQLIEMSGSEDSYWWVASVSRQTLVHRERLLNIILTEREDRHREAREALASTFVRQACTCEYFCIFFREPTIVMANLPHGTMYHPELPPKECLALFEPAAAATVTATAVAPADAAAGRTRSRTRSHSHSNSNRSRTRRHSNSQSSRTSRHSNSGSHSNPQSSRSRSRSRGGESYSWEYLYNDDGRFDIVRRYMTRFNVTETHDLVTEECFLWPPPEYYQIERDEELEQDRINAIAPYLTAQQCRERGLPQGSRLRDGLVILPEYPKGKGKGKGQAKGKGKRKGKGKGKVSVLMSS